jgi:hypothetical protein
MHVRPYDRLFYFCPSCDSRTIRVCLALTITITITITITLTLTLTLTLPDINSYVEIESEERWDAIATTDICQKWWRHMADVMPSNPDGSPVSTALRQVFHME